MKKKTLPVFPNWYPFNDMVLDGHMKVGQYEGVKTRSWTWDYRGPVLFYNSGRTARPALSAYGYRDVPSQHKVIIGVGELVEVRKLTTYEALRMVCNFNNLTEHEISEILRKWGLKPGNPPPGIYFDFWTVGDYISPLETGFFFKKLVRFREPVKFNWPPGPVKPINTTIVAGTPLARELRLAGF